MSNKRSSIPRAVSPATPDMLRDGSTRLSTGSTYDGSSAGPSEPERRLRSPRSREPVGRDNEAVHKKRRTQRPRTTGGFLLPDARIEGDNRRSAVNKDAEQRRSRANGDVRKGKALVSAGRQTPDPATELGLGIEVTDVDMDSDHANSHQTASGSPGSAATAAAHRHVSRIPSPTPRPSTGMLDIDSTQIVNMALNLSESRRMVARRNVSAPVPPRLAPLPDTSAVGSLKQHLHQQRRTSQNLSPRPDKGAVPSQRHPSVSSPMIGSALPHGFDHEGSYTYQFSSSTLNRAQKAKEHLELMAQYRRLLQIVPPLGAQLQQQQYDQGAPSSPPVSPGVGKSPGSFPGQRPPLGRPYNPLQYIRNRKVRARERKAIDGEAQGFGDVSRVTDWIDQAAVSTPLSGSSKLPHFPGAHDHGNNLSNIPRPVTSTGKPKRPRLDWSFEPADMLADAYWFEQDDNRSLIEDRNYAKIFPSKVDRSQRPWSPLGPEQHKASPLSPPSEVGGVEPRNSLQLDAGINRVGTDGSRSSARSRARQKLHEIKGSHKHSDSQHSYHDFLRLGKNATSDTSDSDTDRKRRDRSGTLTASGRDLLEKQMRDILAQEAAEKQSALALQPVPETPSPLENVSDATPFNQNGAAFRPGHVRAESYAGHGANAIAQTERWPALQQSGVYAGRSSLDVPSHSKRSSVDHTFSQPTSPEGTYSRRGSAFMPSGSEMSPSNSRPVSPSRRPLTKVRNIFRDRSRERAEDREAKGRNSIDQVHENLAFTPMDAELLRLAERDRSPSPVLGKLPSRTTGESHKSHRSLGSIKLRGEEVFPFKNIIKGGVKLDSMVRGGVSKMTDMIWKKDSDDSSSSSSSSDESDDEPKRGRRSRLNVLSRDNSRNREKHFLDVMPHFKSTSEGADGRATPSQSAAPESQTSGFMSSADTVKARKSARFDTLKPPRLNVPNSPPQPRISEEVSDVDNGQLDESDTTTDAKSQTDLVSSQEGSRKSSRDLQSVLVGMPHSLETKKRHHSNSLASKRDSGRHWSITDRDITPRQSQLSRSELASVRALILSSGIKAMEISRRANEAHPLFAVDSKGPGVSWSDVSAFVPDEAATMTASQLELYPTTARVLAGSIDNSMRSFHDTAGQLSTKDVPALQQRIDTLHLRIATDLIKTTQETTDDADEVSQDLVHNQRLKVQHVVEAMDKMSRNRRRRFRWFRRMVWLVVEWVLVASMWWLWAAFVIFRFVFLVGKGVWGGVRWLLWL
ncbi:uncharacterized protein B0I36DRAFT_368430 [Microdochium trichocladiopsis]|uniref:Uncharacterized protein n=1 Tax=Microdochium trichocladiopsis TaxID=1682393 RepID=A0A9P9BN29_9PEZI|nr:uncharacterized protein B0I36DRAFT_368430 [Microdochium trichocladiopsis]KAH7018407.1 hypothetical protein B0I36DRAFT_368430 [Microdochium trichocladiopsis]